MGNKITYASSLRTTAQGMRPTKKKIKLEQSLRIQMMESKNLIKCTAKLYVWWSLGRLFGRWRSCFTSTRPELHFQNPCKKPSVALCTNPMLGYGTRRLLSALWPTRLRPGSVRNLVSKTRRRATEEKTQCWLHTHTQRWAHVHTHQTYTHTQIMMCHCEQYVNKKHHKTSL